MTPLRLLLVSEPSSHGVFTVLDAIVNHIHSCHPEITVDLAYSSRRASPDLHLLITKIAQHGGRTIDLDINNFPAISDLGALWQLAWFTKQRNHQLVHAHCSKAGALMRILRCLSLTPPLLYSPQAYYGMARFGSLKEKIFNVVESLLGHIGITICCSEGEQDFALKDLRLSPRKLRLIHHGIDTGFFIPGDPAAKASARATLGLPATGKLLVSIGRVSTQKNYTPLYSLLDEMLPTANWFFSHAGEGSINLAKKLCPAASERCHNFNYLNNIILLLQAADGFVMTSRYEGNSIALLNALSCGLPIFLSNAQGFLFLRRLGFDEITWLGKPSEEESLRKNLKKAITSWASQPSQILIHQRDLVCQYFSQTIQIEKLITLYKSSQYSGETPRE
jgi:glycosyltransferase involved in cell wall biosynthesis